MAPKTSRFEPVTFKRGTETRVATSEAASVHLRFDGWKAVEDSPTVEAPSGDGAEAPKPGKPAGK